MTPVKRLIIGDEVVVVGYEDQGSRRIVDLYNQTNIPGGVRLDKPVGHPLDVRVGMFVSWNEDALTVVRRKT